jgi:hypothetical protein
MIMMKRTTILTLAITLAIVLFAFPTMAAVTTISQGNTVFIGEEGLDVSNAVGVDNQIGWWASGAAISTSSPDSTFSIGGSKTSFAVTPVTFGSYLGTWYRLDSSGKANGTAFIVANPILNLRVEDKSVGVDVTQNKWVYRGDLIGFRIETNLDAISSQRATAATIAIKVQPPGGGEYSALVNGATTNDITSIGITTSPQDTGAIWDTGNSVYPSGTYTAWAECNTNRMKDNYGVTGKTISTTTSFINTEINPVIGVNVPTTSPTVQVTTVPTTVKTTMPATRIPTTVRTTTMITSVPVTPATLQPPETIIQPPVATTPTKSSGFGVVLSAIAVSLIAVAVLRKR